MTTKYLIGLALPLFFFLAFISCAGPDHSNPKSVADAAMQCYVNEDFEGMKKLLNPNDKEKQEAVDNFIKFAESLKDKGIGTKSRNDKGAFEDYTITWMKDPFGYPLNDNTKELHVYYKSSNGKSKIIELEKINGKWYLDTIPL